MTSSWIVPVSLVAISILLTYVGFQNPTLTKHDVVFGFLPDYRAEAADLDFIVPRVSHLCFFGSEADKETGDIIERLPSKEILKRARTLSYLSGTKLLVAFGGAGRSEFFTALASDFSALQRFVQQLIRLLKRENLDGVELNWMYPGTRKDLKALEYMVSEIRRDIPKVIITISINPNPQYSKLLKDFNFDYFHIMMYQNGIGGGTKGMDAAMHTIRTLSGIIPPEKLTLGIPFYGTKGRDSVSYEEIVTKYSKESKGIVYENKDYLLEKKQLAQSYKLAGIAIWELGQDCRVHDVGSHKKTCPNGVSDSLLEKVRK